MIVPDFITSRTLGTSTAKTQLSGDKSGNATSYVVPAWCRSLLGIRPYAITATPVANVGANVTVKLESDDLGLKDFEVFCNPAAAPLSTTSWQWIEPSYETNYPLALPTFGGERVDFFGIQQEAHSTAFRAGVTVMLSDQSAPSMPYRARVGGTAGAAGSNTSTGTSAASVSGATITISGTMQRTIVAAYGVVVPTTYAITDDTNGRFVLSSPEMAVTIQFGFEPTLASLGSVGQGSARLSRIEGIQVGLAPPSTIATSIVLDVAPGTLANFAN